VTVGGLLQLQGRLAVASDGRLNALRIVMGETALAPLYTQLLQPLLATTALEDLAVAGKLGLELELDRDGLRQGAIRLTDIDLTDRRNDGVDTPPPDQTSAPGGVFALQGLNGELHWGDQEISRLGWQGGQLLGGLTLGPTTLQLQLDPQGGRLTEPAHLPLLDGALVMEELSATFGGDEPGLAVALGGYLTPISMPAFSTAMGWPPLEGQISGMIPRIHYRNDAIEVEGVLLFRLFDGEVLVRELHLQEPFGVFPRLLANLEVRNLDLETLTRAFSFGKITGRLEGTVSDLALEQWEPVAFDAAFATPPDDPGPHRINQRAVENLSNLGGAGLSGALSRGMLQFFDDFHYRRLGFRCRLADGVCEMDGIEPAAQGYYLVMGGGIPRIDVLGFNRRIDWKQLLAKLKQIAAGGEPVIQ
jgi:hypothetical protein